MGREGAGAGEGEGVIKEEVMGISTGQKCQGPQCRRHRELAKSSLVLSVNVDSVCRN